MLPTVDIAFIAAELDRLGNEIECALEDGAEADQPRFEVLSAGLQALLERLGAAEAESPTASALAPSAGTGPDALLTHGLDLLTQLSALAERLRLPQAARSLDALALPLACWLIRRGAELHSPEPVVEAASILANALRDPGDLAALFGLMREVTEAFSPLRIQESASGDPSHPWRRLLLDRAVVATRSLSPPLMSEAFDLLCEQMPEAAPDFFRESMGRIDALDYPEPVRKTVALYYARWSAGQRLH